MLKERRLAVTQVRDEGVVLVEAVLRRPKVRLKDVFKLGVLGGDVGAD